jgi:TPR repeat protein
LETGHFFAVLFLLFALILGAISLIGLLPLSASAGMTLEEVKAFNVNKAFNENKAKAERGDRLAQLNLAYCYNLGLGVAKDEVEAVKWYRKAADQGYANAQRSLGLCYLNGEGVAKDEVEAYAYFNLAQPWSWGASGKLAILEKGMSPDARLRGQQRTKELQKEIEAKITAKKAGK